MTTTEYQNVEIPRDRFGRPMVLDPAGKKRLPYRRCTTFVGCLEDTYNLMAWKTRQVAYGMGQRKDLVIAAAATTPADKATLNDIANKATEHAGGSASATTGTALHSLTERIDRGQELGVIPSEFEADIDAYRAATANIEWVGIEDFRVHDEWQVAGTADRLGRFPWSDRIKIFDIKTGSIDYPHKMAMQLAMYARMTPYDIATDTRTNDPGDIDTNTGVIIHLPAGQGVCNLYEIDLAKGWGACIIAKQVWDWRATKNLTRLIEDAKPKPIATWESLILGAHDLDRLREVWKRAAELGEMTTELKALARQRSQELGA